MSRSLDCSLDLQAEKIPRLATKLLVAAAQSAQRVERAFAEAAPHLRQVVGHLGLRQPELAGELGVAHALDGREIVAFEEGEGNRAAPLSYSARKSFTVLSKSARTNS